MALVFVYNLCIRLKKILLGLRHVFCWLCPVDPPEKELKHVDAWRHFKPVPWHLINPNFLTSNFEASEYEDPSLKPSPTPSVTPSISSSNNWALTLKVLSLMNVFLTD
ncbi:hypothetical protein H0H92_003201 [Tricholoma furcatifolium]|nr:hypothetical protein H0H92_003201 [Tricholoma furcatifolium]